MIALYPGSFDPITLGHEDIILRASKQFNTLVVGISEDNLKINFLNLEQRLELARSLFSDHSNIKIMSYQGLTVDFSRKLNASVIVRGLRNGNDFQTESQMAQLNSQLAPEVETIFFNSMDKYRSISSSLVRQIHFLKGDTSPFVSPKTQKVLESLK